jgi:VWFA-related protein
MTRTTVFSGILSVLSGSGLLLSMAAAPAAQRSTQDRSLFVSVVDQEGAPVPDLGIPDFVVKEDNQTREVLRVSPATEPMQIAVLVDTSQAARNQFTYIRQALPDFVATLTAPNDGGRRSEIAIIGVGERPTILSDYSSDPAQIKKGIDRIWSVQNSGMYLLDAIIEVSQGLKKREAPRPVLVAIATSGVEYSNRQHDQVVDPLKTIGAAFYALMLGQPDSSLSSESRERAIVLDEGPRVTGGAYEQLLTGMALAPKLKQLAEQLTHQYKVTYARPESLIPPEKITVAAAKPGLAARGTPVREEQARP